MDATKKFAIAQGLTQLDIDLIGVETAAMFEEHRERMGSDNESYLIWLLAKCDDIVRSIAQGENLPKVAIHIGILRQEMSNIIGPILKSGVLKNAGNS